MAFPAAPKVEIEWVTGSNSWTDVTADVDMSAGISIHYGRTDQFIQPSTAFLSLILVNKTGKYTPGTQLLADKVTANPNYPNVIPHRRIRFSWTISSTTYYRFWGFIRGFPPMVENGIRPFVQITANCRMNDLAGLTLRGWFREEIALQTTPLLAYYPMNDPAPASGLGSAFFTDQSGNGYPNMVQPYIGQTAYQAWVAGASDPMPQSEGQTGASFQVQSGSSTNLGALQVTLPLAESGTCVGFWVTFPPSVAGVTSQMQFKLSTRTVGIQYISMLITDTGTGPVVQIGEAGTSGSITYLSAGSFTAGTPHFITYRVFTQSGFIGQVHIDGVSTSLVGISDTWTITQLEFDSVQTVSPAASGPIVLGGVVVFVGTVSSVAPSAANLYNAGTGWANQLTGTNVQKLLTYCGMTSADWSVDAGAETLSGQQNIMGLFALDVLQQIAVTEGGGSVFYTLPTGVMRFADRNSRLQALIGSSALILDAVLDLDGTQYNPAFDDTTAYSRSTVTREGGLTQTYISPTSTAAQTDQVTSYAASDTAALSLAQYRVAASQAAFRFGQVVLNALTATTSRYVAVAGAVIGTELEVDSLTPGVNAPASKVQTYVEGWTETYQVSDTGSKYDWAADTTPAPAYWSLVAGDANLGRVSEDAGTWTLTSTITNSATSLSLTTAATHPVMTNTAGDLPLYIQIGTEIIQVTAVSGSSSPQTLTVVRGQQSTIAAAQTAGSVISGWPGAGLAL